MDKEKSGKTEAAKVKPIVIFTNFWDAQKMIDNKFILLGRDTKVYKLNFFKDKTNFSVHSIALSHPPLVKLSALKVSPKFNAMDRIDCFCPTYTLLHKYKEDMDWEHYVDAYKKILRERKDRVKYWVDSLQHNHIYILCCWENTSLKSKCHRQLVYQAFNSSAYTKDKMITIYRHGNELKSPTIGVPENAVNVNSVQGDDGYGVEVEFGSVWGGEDY
ncbi:hypothetical protein D4R86_01795 [bacterium]|nr:MAG: hypothetical protein D4R86_01795 [bacterium]